MNLYRKRPVVVSAYQHTGTEPLIISTLEGDMRAEPGDWIITGINGEKYPCKPDIFEKTYEPVVEGKETSKNGLQKALEEYTKHTTKEKLEGKRQKKTNENE